MKTIVLLFAAFIMLASSCQPKASAVKTETLKVYGNCEMCKERIEKAAVSAGVQKATWDINSHMLTISLDTTKVKSTNVQKAIAAVGHDTELAMASDSAYNALPSCCKYERKK